VGEQKTAETPATVVQRFRFRTVVPGGREVVSQIVQVSFAQPKVRRARLSGLNFDTDKTFLLPSAMVGIRQLVKLFKSFEGLLAVVDGHTDKQLKPGASQEVNRTLSVERAESVKAFLLDDAQAWQKFYAGTPHSAKWGVREDQLMLSAVKDDGGSPFYQGPIDGSAGPLTRDAWKRFQTSRSLTVTEAGDKPSRLELVKAYMQLEGTSLPSDAQVQTHGCGQTHPLPETEGDPNPDQPKNRRVEVFLFEKQIDPAPVTPCPKEGCKEHAVWVARQVLDVDLDQPPGNLAVTVQDDAGAALSGARVHASGPLELDGQSGSDGTVPGFDEIVPGSYAVHAEADDFQAVDQQVDVAAGGSTPVTLQLAPEKFSLTILVEDQAKKPLSGASVAIDAPGAQAQTTGDDGTTSFAGLPRGKFHVTVTHQGFQQGAADVQLPPPKQKTSQGLNDSAGSTQAGAGSSSGPLVIPLNAAPAELHVTVVDAEQGNPLPNASVKVEQGPVTVTHPSDDKGETPFPQKDGLVDGNCDITVSLANFTPATVTASLVSTKDNSQVVRLDGALEVAVQTQDDAGQPLTGVHVELSGPSQRSGDGGANASVQFTKLNPGSYQALGTKAGFEGSPSVGFKLPLSTPAPTLKLQGHADLGVQVLDKATGNPLPKATAKVKRKGTAKEETQQADDKGVATFKNLVTGKYEVRASANFHRDGLGDDADVVRGAANLGTVKLEHEAAVNFTATDTFSNVPLDDVAIHLTGTETKDAKIPAGGAASGAVRLLIGEYKVEATRKSYDPLTIGKLALAANDGTIKAVELPMLPSVRLTVEVKGFDPKRALFGAFVTLTPQGKPKLVPRSADREGLVKLGPLDAVEHAVHVEATNHRPFDGKVVLANGDNRFAAALEATNEVAIRFQDSVSKAAVTGAHVEITGRRETKKADGTGAGGVAVLKDVLAGDYTATVTHPDFGTATVPLHVHDAFTGRTDVTIDLHSAVVELVGPDGSTVLTQTRLGFFDGPFDDPATRWMNLQADASNFVSQDSRRFNIRIRDPSAAAPTIEASLRTVFAGGAPLDDNRGKPALQLAETPAGSKTFLSQPVMLINDDDDQRLDTNRSGAVLHPGDAGHRLRRGDMFSKVEIEYPPGHKKQFPIFDRTQARTLPLHVALVTETTGAPSTFWTPAVVQTIVDRDLRIMRQCYERLNIFVTLRVPSGWKGPTFTVPATATRGAETFAVLDLPSGATWAAIDLAAETAMAKAFPAEAKTVRVFFFGLLANLDRRAETSRDLPEKKDRRGCSFIGHDARTPYTMAHEVGHVLTNKAENGGHYTPHGSATTARLNDQNLMRDGTSHVEGSVESKRLWDGNDQDGVDQVARILASPFLKR
jgi:outer membrane protein OmpA-like peptidoglycan-associated protein